ncbi:hypothetical protein [Alteribacter populi]|uniref:hypothetical protein n=1 Tax=Alteribacter populi TaxID=2011011 RepID=UPI000BBAFAF5|nr:hypothetical protein [Alteribacter populi]
MIKKRVDLKFLAEDLPTLDTKEINDMIPVFLIYSHSNDYYAPDMQKACNMCIRELKRRGYQDGEEIPWED